MMIDRVGEYLLAGGWVMPVLLGLGIVLWTLLGLRWQLLRRPISGDLEAGFAQAGASQRAAARGDGLMTAHIRDGGAAVIDMRLGRFRRLIRSLCAVAPLLGLLGTVNGMIETFSSLFGMQLFAQSGGVAGGIAEALISTQMGLFVAVTGIVASRYLDQRQRALRAEVQRAQELLLQDWHAQRQAAP